MGDCHDVFIGEGVPENTVESIKWLRLAAENGICKYALGSVYKYGYRVAENYKTAVKWYRLAAKTGSCNGL